MIYKNNKAINEWYFNDAELIKVYKNGAICYYKMVLGETPQQVPCFAVVDNIQTYSDTEFVDVYDKATEKWYKLNNLDQYEQYGVYGSGRTITYYEGKLTIDNGYEYEYSGNAWVNIGEVSGSSRLPQGYTEVEYVENTTSAYTETDFYPTQNTRVVAELQATDITNNPRMFGAGAWNDLGFICNIERLETPNPNKYYFKYGNTNTWYHTNVSADTNKHKFDLNKNEYYIDDVLAGTAATTSFTMTYHLGIFNAPNKTSGAGAFSNAEAFNGKCYSFKVYESDVLVRDLVPCINPSNVVGFYDVVNDTFYGSANNYAFVAGSTKIVYPKYYTEKDEPENNVVFTDMEDALAYQCPWVGMKATIDGVRYVFSGDSQSGYEWVERTSELPDVPFILNYNAKNYDATNRKLLKTEGQLRDSDAVCNYGYHIVDHSADGYITVTGDTRMIISGTPYMNRNNTQTGCTMTIVSKVKTNSGYSILTNRNNNMNWMWRYPSNGIFLHGSSSYNNPKYLVSTTGQPITASIRISYDGSVKQQLNDWTNNGSYNGAFQYGSESTGNSAMFCDYTTSNSEFWKGDFYWVYMSFNVLTDEQIQQVIDYNENL